MINLGDMIQNEHDTILEIPKKLDLKLGYDQIVMRES